MIISEEEKKENSSTSVLESDRYPYGLKIHIDEDTYKKLGLGAVPKVGEKFAILAMAEVADIHQNKTTDDRMHVSMSLQITDMDMKAAEEEKEEKKPTSEVLYG